MKKVAQSRVGFWYQRYNAPPVFVPKVRAYFQPTDNAFYSQGMVAPGKPARVGNWCRLIPGEGFVYAQRYGAPPMVLPPQMVAGDSRGVGVVGGGFAIQYERAIYTAPLLDPRTGQLVTAGVLTPVGYTAPARDVTTVYFVEPTEGLPYLLIVEPGERVTMPGTVVPPEFWMLPFGNEVQIDGIQVDDGLLYFED